MIKKLIILGIIFILAAVALFTSYYTVDEKEQAVVTTFGKVTSITEAGFHFKAPFGIQKVQKVPVNVYQKLEIGYKTDKKGNVTAVEEESKMITGDYNIVNIDFFVEYRISDPEKYLFSSQDPDEVLKNLAQSQIRNVVGSATVDSVLTDGKSEIQMQVKELVTEILAEYDPETRGGDTPDGRKVRGTIHWVDAKNCAEAEVRLYSNLFSDPDPDAGDFLKCLNPDSLTVLTGCRVEKCLENAQAPASFQFLRTGYFCPDNKDSVPGKLVFNRAVALKDSFNK